MFTLIACIIHFELQTKSVSKTVLFIVNLVVIDLL